ncbi:MAG: hypothetical protein OHK005_09090 [Candidatus Methylacidiphilales bacterium]
MAYFGTLYNLLPELRDEEWQLRLRKIGINFIIQGDVSKHGNYSSIDCIVAVRPADRNPNQKPPNKLWNAWRAGVPVILGPEAGFREVRKGPDDYIEVATAEEVFTALLELKSNPSKVSRMRENGLLRSAECAPTAISSQWIRTLSGPIRELYQAYQNRKVVERWIEDAPKHLRAIVRGIRR